MVGISAGLKEHEELHVNGGSDELDSPLSLSAMPHRIHQQFYGANEGQRVNATKSALNHYATVLMDAAGERIYLNVIVPPDYASLPKLKIVYSRITAEPIADHYLTWAAADEAIPTHSEDKLNLTYTSCNTNGDIGVMDIGMTFANLTAGDIVGIEIRHGTNNFHILGVIFEYTD